MEAPPFKAGDIVMMAGEHEATYIGDWAGAAVVLDQISGYPLVQENGVGGAAYIAKQMGYNPLEHTFRVRSPGALTLVRSASSTSASDTIQPKEPMPTSKKEIKPGDRVQKVGDLDRTGTCISIDSRHNQVVWVPDANIGDWTASMQDVHDAAKYGILFPFGTQCIIETAPNGLELIKSSAAGQKPATPEPVKPGIEDKPEPAKAEAPKITKDTPPGTKVKINGREAIFLGEAADYALIKTGTNHGGHKSYSPSQGRDRDIVMAMGLDPDDTCYEWWPYDELEFVAPPALMFDKNTKPGTWVMYRGREYVLLCPYAGFTSIAVLANPNNEGKDAGISLPEHKDAAAKFGFDPDAPGNYICPSYNELKPLSAYKPPMKTIEETKTAIQNSLREALKPFVGQPNDARLKQAIISAAKETLQQLFPTSQPPQAEEKTNEKQAKEIAALTQLLEQLKTNQAEAIRRFDKRFAELEEAANKQQALASDSAQTQNQAITHRKVIKTPMSVGARFKIEVLDGDDNPVEVHAVAVDEDHLAIEYSPNNPKFDVVDPIVCQCQHVCEPQVGVIRWLENYYGQVFGTMNQVIHVDDILEVVETLTPLSGFTYGARSSWSAIANGTPVLYRLSTDRVAVGFKVGQSYIHIPSLDPEGKGDPLSGDQYASLLSMADAADLDVNVRTLFMPDLNRIVAVLNSNDNRDTPASEVFDSATEPEVEPEEAATTTSATKEKPLDLTYLELEKGEVVKLHIVDGDNEMDVEALVLEGISNGDGVHFCLKEPMLWIEEDEYDGFEIESDPKDNERVAFAKTLGWDLTPLTWWRYEHSDTRILERIEKPKEEEGMVGLGLLVAGTIAGHFLGKMTAGAASTQKSTNARVMAPKTVVDDMVSSVDEAAKELRA